MSHRYRSHSGTRVLRPHSSGFDSRGAHHADVKRQAELDGAHHANFVCFRLTQTHRLGVMGYAVPAPGGRRLIRDTRDNVGLVWSHRRT
jgi:hypothetical protein